MANTTDSIFTKIIKREIPAKIRFEDDDFIVIDDLYPKAPVHVLIIPKQPYASLEAVPIEDAQFTHRLFSTARKVASQLGISDNYKLFMNVGEKVQAVHHLHLHLMGGYSKEKSQLTFQE